MSGQKNNKMPILSDETIVCCPTCDKKWRTKMTSAGASEKKWRNKNWYVRCPIFLGFMYPLPKIDVHLWGIEFREIRKTFKRRTKVYTWCIPFEKYSYYIWQRINCLVECLYSYAACIYAYIYTISTYVRNIAASPDEK